LDKDIDTSKALEPLSPKQIQGLSRKELILFCKEEQKLRLQLQAFYHEIKKVHVELQEKKLLIEERYVLLKSQLFSKSSERTKQPNPKTEKNKKKKKRKKRCQKPSDRYPNIPLIQQDLEFEIPPTCTLCEAPMMDAGMVETSEFLTVVPMAFTVIEQNRHKYKCSKCHGDIQTTPAPPRICPGSSYSDEMIVDVALSKYCDLIPIGRYAAMAARRGVVGLPPQSLIELTHYLADFLKPVYNKIRDNILLSRVIQADETPHRMLEGGGDKANWYLWGFSNKVSSYFEIHNTRSGDVAGDILIQSTCEKLLSDVFSGYPKAVNTVNKQRVLDNKPLIQNCYCNAHARRKFTDAETRNPEEVKRFLSLYRKIYRLEKIALKRPLHRILRVRKYMKPLFDQMKLLATNLENTVSSKSLLATAIHYFCQNFDGLTHFLIDPEVPIDNNQQERLLRSPVVGRKTWYGTHSRRGAETNAVLFTLIESCKLCGVNPRQYFKYLVPAIHANKSPPIPSQFKEQYLPLIENT
jgi:transposase